MVASSKGSVLPDILGMLREIVFEHRRRAGSGEQTQVVPVLMQGLDSWLGVLAEVTRAEGGAFLESASYTDGCDARLDICSHLSDLHSAVSSLCQALQGLALEVEGTFVRLTGVGVGADSASQDVLRGVAAALFDPDLRDIPFVTLVFEEPTLDDVVAAPLWSLLMRLPQVLALPPGRTIVVVAGDADLVVDRHCVGDPSVRYDVREDCVLPRRPRSSSLHAVNDVARIGREDAPLLFLFTGAGASQHFGLPTGNELRNRALAHWLGDNAAALPFDDQARRFYYELASGDRLRDVEHQMGPEAFAAALTLERVLREEQWRENRRDSHTIRQFIMLHEFVIENIRARSKAGARPSPLAQLVLTGRPVAILTVNFDQTLEAESGSAVRSFVTEDDFANLGQHLDDYLAGKASAVPYIKLHGDVGSPNTIVANIDETEGGLSQARLHCLRMLRDRRFNVRPWVYIGYSMRDLDVQPVLAAPDIGDGLVEWWVGPFVDPAVRSFLEQHRVPRWRGAGRTYSIDDRCVTMTAIDYLAALLDVM